MSAAVLQKDKRQIVQTTPASLAERARGANGGGRLPLHSGDRLTRLEF